MKYTRRSPEQKLAIVAAWRASGEPLSRFAPRAGVAKSSLADWAQRSSTRLPVAFHEVEVAVPPPGAPGFGLTLAGSGHRVEVPTGFDAADLRRLVDALC